MKSPRSRTVCSASPISGSTSPEHVQQGGAARGRRQALGDVDEQPPAGLVHRRERRQLPHGEPERLHGVGHHLLVTDGDVDVVLVVAGRGDREQRGDRPALDDLEARRRRGTTRCPAGGRSAPRSAGPARTSSHDLRVRQRRLRLPAPARSPCRRPRRPAPCRRPGSPGRRPGPRRGRGRPPRRRPCGWT